MALLDPLGPIFPIGGGGDDGGDDGGGGGGGVDLSGVWNAIGDLRGRVDDLVKSLSVSVLGVQLLENPEGFVIATLLKWFIETTLGITGAIAFRVNSVMLLIGDVVSDGLEAALGPAGAAIASLILGVISDVDSIIDGLVASTGPFAPFVALLVWVVVIYVAVWVGRRLISLILGLLLGTVRG